MLENMNVIVATHRSFHYGSFITYVFSWLIFYYVILLREGNNNRGLSRIKIDDRKIDRKIDGIRTLMIGITALEVIVFLSVCTKPYFLYAIDRVTYAESVMPSWIKGHIGFFVLFLPLAVAILQKDKMLALFYMGLYFLINLWVGDKFTGLVLGFYIVAFSYLGLFGAKIDKKVFKRVIYAMAFAVISLLLIVYFQMKIIGGRDFGYYLTERISAQGYLWWLTYGNNVNTPVHITEIGDELYPFFHTLSGRLVDYDFGIYKLMKLYQESNRWRGMLEAGFRGTESTRATFYYYGGILGLMLGQTILALTTAKITDVCFQCLKKRDWVRIIAAIYILRNFIAVYSMSDFYLLVKLKMIICYFILICKVDFKQVVWLPAIRIVWRPSMKDRVDFETHLNKST
jgi:hypothetical protein